MGKAKGSSSTKQLSTLSPGQQELQGLLQGLSPDLLNQLMGIGTGDLNEQFQQSIVDPAMLSYQQDIIPGIQERFGGDTSASSALNQTLGQSAENLGTMLGGQFGQFAQQQQQNQMQALTPMLQAMLGQQVENVTKVKPGWLDPVLGGAMNLGGGFLGGKF